ncbi:MAG TPA: acyltransferase, partial [Pilimelia sp.]|nr:acyltransferase [Pilimelia sp.]
MRNRYLDVLRAAAILRVVVYHVTAWVPLTWVFPAMSVMFALAGSLMAASLDRHGARAVGRRLRRLLPAFWMLAAVFVPAMLATGLPLDWRLLWWVLPLHDPPANDWGALVLSVIWYLRDILWFALLSPLALPLFRRHPLPMLLLPYAVLAAATLGLPMPSVVADFGLYFGAWLLGFAHHDGLLRRIRWRVLLPVMAVLLVVGAWYAVHHPGPRGLDLNDIRPANGLWSAAVTLLLLRVAPAPGGAGRLAAAVDWLLRRPGVDRVVTVLNSRALTIYLWHMPIVIGVGLLAARQGWATHDATGTAVRLAVVGALVAVPVALFGWVEDLAARRRGHAQQQQGHGRGPQPVGRADVVEIEPPRPGMVDRVPGAH